MNKLKKLLFFSTPLAVSCFAIATISCTENATKLLNRNIKKLKAIATKTILNKEITNQIKFYEEEAKNYIVTKSDEEIELLAIEVEKFVKKVLEFKEAIDNLNASFSEISKTIATWKNNSTKFSQLLFQKANRKLIEPYKAIQYEDIALDELITFYKTFNADYEELEIIYKYYTIFINKVKKEKDNLDVNYGDPKYLPAKKHLQEAIKKAEIILNADNVLSSNGILKELKDFLKAVHEAEVTKKVISES